MANKNRTYKVFETLYNRLLTHYNYILTNRHQSHIIEEIKDRSIKLIDSTVISLCLSMFDWAKFRTAKGGIKIHTCWDDTMMIPDVVNITPAKLHDRYGLEQLVFSKGTIVVEDRAYFDFSLMLQRVRAENVFVTRIKTNTLFETAKELELPIDTDQDILKDEIITLTSNKAVKTGISKVQLRLVHVYIGISKRRGQGKIRHLHTCDLWVQEQTRTERNLLEKILGTENTADIFTKYLDHATMAEALTTMNCEFRDGRAKAAPDTMGLNKKNDLPDCGHEVVEADKP